MHEQVTAWELPTGTGAWKVKWDALGLTTEWAYVVFRLDTDTQLWVPVRVTQDHRWVDRNVAPYTAPKYRVYAIRTG